MRSRGSLLAVTAIVCACAGGNDDAGGKACSSFAANLCARVNACVSLFVETTFGDVEACTAREKLTCTPQFGAPGSGASTGNVSACADAIRSWSCDDLLDGNLPAACASIRGSLSVGSVCVTTAQCPVGTVCNVQADHTCGTCNSLIPEGDACANQSECAVGLTCAANSCVAFVDMGGACDIGHPCKGTLTCKNGMCAAKVGAGEACTVSTDCDNLHGIYCNTQMMVCQALPLAAIGEPCGLLPGGLTQCLASLCNVPTGAQMGTCEGFAADGASCGMTGSPGATCLSPAVCVAGSADGGPLQGSCTLPSASACR